MVEEGVTGNWRDKDYSRHIYTTSVLYQGCGLAWQHSDLWQQWILIVFNIMYNAANKTTHIPILTSLSGAHPPISGSCLFNVITSYWLSLKKRVFFKSIMMVPSSSYCYSLSADTTGNFTWSWSESVIPGPSTDKSKLLYYSYIFKISMLGCAKHSNFIQSEKIFLNFCRFWL